jgi:hypothetical protein
VIFVPFNLDSHVTKTIIYNICNFVSIFRQKKNYKNVLGSLKFGGHIVHQWYNNIYENQIFCSFIIYTRDILSCAICCCVLGRLPAADTHSVEAGILSDDLLQ